MTEHEQDSKFTKNKRQDGENKMDIQEWIIFAIELIGTVAFSASGAMVGIECSMDIFGVIVLGVSTAVGGGMVRDVILGKVPSALLHPVYVIYAVLAAVLVFCIIYFRRKYLQDGFGEVYDKLMLAMDSVGLGIFSAMGVTKGISCGYIDNTFLLVFLGTMTGVGGGLLRDTMAGVAPYIFVKHIYACASIAGAWICVIIYRSYGELPAMVMVDAISRMVPGVLTNDESGSTESFEGDLLEYPQYSRPEEWMGKKVPPVLLSGNHKLVDEWRREQSIIRTKERRPDLFARAELTEKERKKWR